MKKKIMGALCALAMLLGFAATASAQGSIPVALQQISDQNGHPYNGALLYFYQAGTVATRQDSFQDTGLTLANQWPLPTDAFGRVPMFYLASGSIHVRLTDPNGLVIFDYPNMLVIGPSGGGGGGGSIDPTTIASTGDVKFRLVTGALTGWVRLNQLTIGSAISGATERANADTQNLFVYLWNNCSQAHCPVLFGKGASAIADFNANKQLQLPDCRSRICMMGVDDMGNAPAGRLFAQNITSGGGDGVTTPLATGGHALHTLGLTEIPVLPFAGTPQTWASNQSNVDLGISSAPGPGAGGNAVTTTGSVTTTITPNGTVNAASGGTASVDMTSPFALGTYYIKL